jgi:hypothetical protein
MAIILRLFCQDLYTADLDAPLTSASAPLTPPTRRLSKASPSPLIYHGFQRKVFIHRYRKAVNSRKFLTIGQSSLTEKPSDYPVTKPVSL